MGRKQTSGNKVCNLANGLPPCDAAPAKLTSSIYKVDFKNVVFYASLDLKKRLVPRKTIFTDDYFAKGVS